MKKETLNLITFILACCSIIFFMFTLNVLALGFSLLFGIMFVIDSFWVFLKRYFIKDRFKAIGGEFK